MESEQKRIDIISFMAPINDSTAGRLIDLAYTAQAEGSSEIHMLISSTGGRQSPAFTAYNFLRTLRIPLHTHNMGTIETPALLVYLASDHRSASPRSRFLLYSFDWTFYRDHIRYPEVVEAAESLRYDTEAYAGIFAERTGGSFDIKQCLTGPAQVLGPVAASQAGIITDNNITAPEIPELAKLWSIHN